MTQQTPEQKAPAGGQGPLSRSARRLKERPLLAVLLAVGLALGLYLLAVEPLQAYRRDLGEQAEAQAKLARRYLELAQQARAEAERLRRAGRAAPGQAKAPAFQSAQELNRRLKAAAESQGLRVRGAQALPPRQDREGQWLRASLQASGQWKQVVGFLSWSGFGDGACRLEQLEAAPSPQGGGLEISAVAAAAAPAAPKGGS